MLKMKFYLDYYAHRKKLLTEEKIAIWDLTEALRIDSSIDLFIGTDFDYFKDYDEDRTLSLKEGMAIIMDALAYPLTHDVNEEDAKVLRNLFREFVDPEWEDMKT